MFERTDKKLLIVHQIDFDLSTVPFKFLSFSRKKKNKQTNKHENEQQVGD